MEEISNNETNGKQRKTQVIRLKGLMESHGVSMRRHTVGDGRIFPVERISCLLEGKTEMEDFPFTILKA